VTSGYTFASMNTVLIVVGIAAVLLGAAGVLGRFDRSNFRLYQGPRQVVSPSRHRTMQRLGGGMLVVVGVIFLVTALSG
jgi:hypothetical protein